MSLTTSSDENDSNSEKDRSYDPRKYALKYNKVSDKTKDRMIFVLMPYVCIPGIGKSALARIIETFSNVEVIDSDTIEHNIVLRSKFLNLDETSTK